MGAWIETQRIMWLHLVLLSHPMWVRGLKHKYALNRDAPRAVASYVGAWIETGGDSVLQISPESHPMWVRGLKPLKAVLLCCLNKSHPMWVRRLKHF